MKPLILGLAAVLALSAKFKKRPISTTRHSRKANRLQFWWFRR